MTLILYNDLTRKKEKFVPIKQGEIKFYVCGPTVYDYFHIGNARPFVLFDVFRRYLEKSGYNVTYVQNFTDIDDKMIKRANDMGITVSELADRFIEEYYKDADALGIKRASIYPRATYEIDEIIQITSKLIEKGHAYAIDGNVYFDVSSFKEYGKLSKQSLDELQYGVRIDLDENKKAPLDFALWKASKEGEPNWHSPWGKGRPGWHIECSAMSTKYLGETIDIHGGGSDLIFPHHENEIAQSECFSGKQFVKYWIHNAYLMIESEKMSKSLGNFKTIRDIRKKTNPLNIRFFLLSAHYRSPINFSAEGLKQAQKALNRIIGCYKDIIFSINSTKESKVDQSFADAIDSANKGFIESMNDDFNTAGAIGNVFEAVRAVHTHLSSNSIADLLALNNAKEFFDMANDVLGLFNKEDSEEIESDITTLIEERDLARKSKDYVKSDEIRDILLSKGISIEDTPQGTRWKKQD